MDYRCPSCERVVTERIAKKNKLACSECGTKMIADAFDEPRIDAKEG